MGLRGPSLEKLSAKDQLFVKYYLLDPCASRAARLCGLSAKGAYRKLLVPKIAHAIEEGQKELFKSLAVSAEAVLENWWTIHQADAGELVEYRRGCCRYCYGLGHHYQWVQFEIEEARKAVEDWNAKRKEDEAERFVNEAGGIGFDPRTPPNNDCPRCFGEGVTKVFIKDTRELSPAARKLYAGVKITKDGLEVLKRDQDAALNNVARHLGMFAKDNKSEVEVEHSGVLYIKGEDAASLGSDPE